uniref:Peptidase S1 domain-containing protein n=1 Tax=Acanthochromis polyacanthus TaxID=80966 RepID=A0A3Q1EHI3_9TELE
LRIPRRGYTPSRLPHWRQDALPRPDIIHGEKASENSLLYMASVQTPRGHTCGGFLITEDFVVTQNKVLCPVRQNVTRKHIIPIFQQLLVKTIQFATSETNENANCYVAGWGKTKTGGHVVNELRVVKVSIIDQQVCQDRWDKIRLPANVICAGGYGTKAGFCQGDSGGPLVCNGMAVGVVSFNKGRNCTYPNVPNVYTDISKHASWINSMIKTF